jgi:hypothetical protein
MAPEMRTEEIAHLQAMAGTIHGNIDALEQIASGQPAAIQSLQPLELSQSLPGGQPQWTGALLPAGSDTLPGNPPIGLGAKLVLVRINQTLLQLGDLLGATKIEHLQSTVNQ